MSEPATEALLKELQEIKKLLVLQLLALGYKQKHVAATLSMSESTLSRMLPKGLPRHLSGSGLADDR
jgi:DNA-binding NarL/FixJ family response regulator